MPEDKLTRLLAMQRQLLCGNAIDKAAAAAEYGVSAKSIQRDLETLRAWFGTQGSDLVYDREADAYRLLQPEEARLTKSEVLAVCKILLESRAFTEEELDPILHKLVACCTPAQNLKAVQELIGNERFHYVPPHHGQKFVDRLWALGEAIRDHRVLEMDYMGTHNGAARHRRVQPVGILFSEYYFYLAAFIEGDRQERALRKPRGPLAHDLPRRPHRAVHGHKGPLRHPLPRPLPGRRDAQAHPVHVRRQVAAHQVQVYRPEHRGRARPPADRPGGGAAARRRAGRRSGGVWLGY